MVIYVVLVQESGRKIALANTQLCPSVISDSGEAM